MTSNIPPPLTLSDLTDAFISKDPGCERVGLEMEKLGLDAGGRPLAVFGDRGVQTILERLCARFGWTAERDLDFIIQLHRDGVTVSVEPGGQLELSTPPGCSLDQAFFHEQTHLRELLAVTEGWGVSWCGAGVHPNAGPEDVEWIPKRRYLIMRDYLGRRGELAHWMMKMTASLQVSVDYRSEADAARKLGVAARLVPVLTALCAASPIVRGKFSGYKSFRSHIWAHTDPDRCGLPDCFFKPDFVFADYVEYALDIPMFFIERAGQLLRTDGLTFRRFLESGFKGHRAEKSDWNRHLTFLFPEIRLKGYLELRCCDRLPDCLSFAVAVLIKSLLYSPQALDACRTWLGGLSAETTRLGLAEAARSGYEGMLAGRPLGQWAAEAVHHAEKGLRDLLAAGRASEREAAWFKILQTMVLDERRSLADRMMEAWKNGESLAPIVRLNCDDPVRVV